jgi:drug/metabolite transporter (DMT)-like permease
VAGDPGPPRGPASLLAPFFYSQLLWVTGLGFLVFGNLPDSWTLAGAAIIIASGLYTAHLERVRRQQQHRA